jgi:hypothetical protein
VADELEFTSGALVNAKGEIVCARIEIEKKIETIRVVRVELKESKPSKMNMLRARETLNEATEGIRTKTHDHDNTVDRLALSTTSLYRATQDKALKDAKVAATALELVRMRHELHQSVRASEDLKDELLDRTT